MMSPPGRDEFRAVMGCFAPGLTIVTTRRGDELHGMPANAVTAVSLDPPLVLVCIDRSADSHDIVDASGVFALSILGREQYALSRHFALKEGPSAHRLDGGPHHSRATGAPTLAGRPASARPPAPAALRPAPPAPPSAAARGRPPPGRRSPVRRTAPGRSRAWRSGRPRLPCARSNR